MEPSTNTSALLTTTPATSSAPLARLSDAELLSGTRRLVGRSNQLLASLLAHLAEVEARGIHRTRACASLYTYCIYELRFSEDEAFRRVAAARLVRRFPALLEAIATGELHLTGLLMLGSHLTPDNLVEVLALAKHRTKKELARLVRRLDPLPEVPPSIEPLGPAQGAAPTNDGSTAARLDHDGCADEHALARADTDATLAEPARVRSDPQRYKVQFEASEEYVELVERAKALLSHTAPRDDLADLHLRAMRALVAELERKKYAVTTRQRVAPGSAAETADEQLDKGESEPAPEPRRPESHQVYRAAGRRLRVRRHMKSHSRQGMTQGPPPAAHPTSCFIFRSSAAHSASLPLTQPQRGAG